MRRVQVLAAIAAILSLTLHGDASAAPNQPPAACFSVAPPQGTVATTFTVNADCSTDDKTPASKLQVRWDWQDDGVWDTAYTTLKTATHQYAAEGEVAIRVEVRDQPGLTGTTTRGVAIQPTLTQVLAGAPPELPGATEPDVDVDPGNPAKVVAAAVTHFFDIGGSVPYPVFFSTDGGATFTRSAGPSPSHSGDPAIEFDTQGAVFLSTMDNYRPVSDGTPFGVKVARSIDGGATFPTFTHAMDSATVFTFPDGTTHSVCDQIDSQFDFPRLAIDKGPTSPHRDNIYVTASASLFDLDGDGTCEPGGAQVIVRSTDGGATWGSARAFPPFTQPHLAIGIAADGTILNASQTFDSTSCSSGSGIALRKSTDGGVTFLPDVCAFMADSSLLPLVTTTAADPGNPARAYIAFRAAVPALGGSSHLYVIRTADGGTTWSAPVRVDDVLPDDNVDHIQFSLSVSANGRLDLIWFDYRNSTPKRWIQGRQPGDVYYSYSRDGGVTWSVNLRLSQSTAPLYYFQGNDYLTVVSSGNRAHAIYSQDQDGNGPYEARLTTITFH